MQPFELSETEHLPGCRKIRVDGELDLAVADQLQQALERVGPEFNQILIDLEGCQFIDSTGMAVIVRAHLRMAEDGRRVGIYGASGQVLRVLSVTGLTANGLVFDSADDALEFPAEE